ncbi:50S ribosomal protein L25 [Miltoncostaea marina]|uniref:50S ribosomal protein L25 n=1 Tax=Miltoncostaea marina TaxID=2843215 RepID=UPI001C3CB7D3|nr:50S ribosomal protein L25 [Miltoncostaea marina]
MAHVALTAQPRAEFGNGPSRRLRRQGLVPGVVYQSGGPSLALALPGHDLKRTLVEGRTSVIDLRIGDDSGRPVLVKDWQLHPTRGDVMHVDFQEVDLTQEITTPVALTLVGSAVGVRDGGVLDQPLREVEVSALPDRLPDEIEADVSALAVGDAMTVADLVAPEGVTIVSDPETVVASVVAPTAEVEESEEGEGAEGAAAEGGESAGE